MLRAALMHGRRHISPSIPSSSAVAHTETVVGVAHTETVVGVAHTETVVGVAHTETVVGVAHTEHMLTRINEMSLAARTQAFGKLAKEGNTLLLPTGVSDPAGMVAQALSIYNTVADSRGSGGKSGGGGKGGDDGDDVTVSQRKSSRDETHAIHDGETDSASRYR
jgi:hypothetical protein